MIIKEISILKKDCKKPNAYPVDAIDRSARRAASRPETGTGSLMLILEQYFFQINC